MVLHRIGGLLLVLLLVGCGAKAPLDVKGTDITNSAEFEAASTTGGRRLALTDHNGRPVTLASFKGKLVVLFFGYTHCPDVCPTTLSDMAQALKLLHTEDAGKVQVLFVSVDPERDTPEMLKAYVPYFQPDFLGLYGTPEQVARASREFKVVYRKHVEPGATDYLIDHSAGSYVLDATGRLRLYLPFKLPPADIAHDLATLLRAG
ncbi:MAG: SCO family protein [Pseudomonadota bacterium]|nr:SCO family protein [Pseudomonadota bacterium]